MARWAESNVRYPRSPCYQQDPGLSLLHAVDLLAGESAETEDKHRLINMEVIHFENIFCVATRRQSARSHERHSLSFFQKPQNGHEHSDCLTSAQALLIVCCVRPLAFTLVRDTRDKDPEINRTVETLFRSNTTTNSFFYHESSRNWISRSDCDRPSPKSNPCGE